MRMKTFVTPTQSLSVRTSLRAGDLSDIDNVMGVALQTSMSNASQFASGLSNVEKQSSASSQQIVQNMKG